ncbi:hypothetical protein GX50_04359 [[Emmonsia] crescens]|uniref:RZ-type domain-containing protein n=1 Tax=[Emmonsia] crescens TaxID=73230 RepID=A0A2B7ZI11_9EURO|nr:hypothetical protein GX50_04359 [Emmonsia crescens]
MDWRFMVPKPGSVIFDLRSKLGDFFQQALILIHQDPALMQEVVMLLATEGGLQRINEIARQDLEALSKGPAADVFSLQIQPLYQLMSHPNILTSAILEQAVGTLYNYLYGLNGRRAIKLFSFCVRMLDENEFMADSLEACVVVFSHMIDINVNATVNEQLHIPAKALARIVRARETESGELSLYHLERINRRLDLGLQIQLKSVSASTVTSRSKAKFKLDQNPPGGRHDNDSADICSIRIMPTFEEIQSTETEYLPVNNPEQLHLPGLQGLLDRQFRLLREDNVGPLRDAIRAELECLQTPSGNQAAASHKKQSQRTFSYRNISLKGLTFERRFGFRFSVRFDKPAPLRKVGHKQQGEWWEQSRRLQLDSLVCILDSRSSIIFCTVCEGAQVLHPTKNEVSLRQSQKKVLSVRTVYENLSEPNQAYVSLKPVTIDNVNMQQLLESFIASQRVGRVTLALVEFPGILLPSFQPTLLALQQMQRKADCPFGNFLAPLDPHDKAVVNVPPPAYSLKPGFRFDLSCIMDDGAQLLWNPREQVDLKKIMDGSSLDDAQALALVDSLSRGLALIQGPPGTGKSYTGVALVKVLLASKGVASNDVRTRFRIARDLQNNVGADIGPIICVCYTNHALDQLLEHFVKDGIEQVIRIGSRSKSELLSECTLRKVAQNMQKTKTEGSRMFELITMLEMMEKKLEGLFGELSVANSQATIRAYLQSKHSKHYLELFGEEDHEGFKKVNRGKRNALNHWFQGGHRDIPGRVIKPRHTRVLTRIPLKTMSHAEREVLHQLWLSEITVRIFDTVKRLLLETHDTQKELEKIRREVDLRCLNQANIIGATTSGLARNIDLLHRVRAKVMLCEEAGEVLESHTLTAFLPSLQHVILIGDHLQLRPQIQNYHLQHDTPTGRQYSLDISLFERLVQPPKPFTAQFPFRTLETQRRMHPSISKLIRDTLYPRLQDSASVSEYPQVTGLRKRLFWFDHEMEENYQPEAISTSRTNDFEVDMTAALVTHIVRQGVYSSEDVAVLTPYLGQLQKLKQRFASSFEIVLNDMDQEDLQNTGLEGTEGGATTIQISKTSLRNTLRLATVDNFQGEEAAVVVISLVRCNAQNNCGFLKTFNRINVLLSRAKHGMYIIGNARTSGSVEMWNNVITILKESESFGTSLELMCPRHPDTPITISKPDDFTIFSPEGGCSMKCDKRLHCGHACVSKCHSDVLHAAVKCLEPCPRSLKGCNHPCPNVCGDSCIPKCNEVICDPDRVLPCGHKELKLPCWQSQDIKKVTCRLSVRKNVAEITLPASTPVPRNATGIRLANHAKILAKSPVLILDVLRNATSPVLHVRKKTARHHAHTANALSPVQFPVITCHARNDARKYWPAIINVSPSVCGEICPDGKFCQTCAHGDIKEMIVDFIESHTYGEVDLDEDPCIFPKCGHVITMTNMDGQMSLGDHYEFSTDGSINNVKSSNEPFSSKEVKNCPSCRGSLRDIARYGRIVRRAMLDEATKRFIVWSNIQYVPLAERLCEEQKQLERSIEKVPDISGLVVVAKSSVEVSPTRQLESPLRARGSGRYSKLNALRSDIVKYIRNVSKNEQPFQRVVDMVKNARRRRGSPEVFIPASNVLQTRGQILATSLLLQCDLTIMSDFISSSLKTPGDSPPADRLFKDLVQSRKDCLYLISMAGESAYPIPQVEGHLYLAKYAALERALSESDKATELLSEATTHLTLARHICYAKPSTVHMLPEIDATERALRESTFYSVVTSEEMQAVVAAMRSEFRGTGHWYYCENNHPFTIGECGMPMQEATCPQCSARIGGNNHHAVEGVRPATELEIGLERLAL